MSGDNVGVGQRCVHGTIILMGPSGSGKTSVGQVLSSIRGDQFVDADDHHDDRSIEKMRRGESLTDEDRAPWLQRLAGFLRQRNESTRVVLACSALKTSYRRVLADGRRDVVFVHLLVDERELARRLHTRTGHYAGPELLQSQLRTWEAPDSDPGSPPTLVIGASGDLKEIVDRVVQELNRVLATAG